MHWSSVHWDSNMEHQQTMKPAVFASQKAVHVRAHRPTTAPLPATPSRRPAGPTSGNHPESDSELASNASSGSAESDSENSDSEKSDSDASYESESDTEGEAPPFNSHHIGGRVPAHVDHANRDQLPDRCLRDRCLRPVTKLQQETFMPTGKQENLKAEPEGLIWQNSGFMTPFTPELLNLKHGRSKQISSAASGVTTLQDTGKTCQHVCNIRTPSNK